MTDRKGEGMLDIVERLRMCACDDCTDAADEIERLRSIVASQDKWVPKQHYYEGNSTVRPYSMLKTETKP